MPAGARNSRKRRMKMTKISGLEFGSIEINGKKYGYDVVVLPDGTVKEREASKAAFGDHAIKKTEIEELAKAKPDSIVVGTGTMGMARVSPDAEAYARQAKLNLVVLPSSDAIDKVNQLVDKGKPVAALIHITC
jgi:hypothetical protein